MCGIKGVVRRASGSCCSVTEVRSHFQSARKIRTVCSYASFLALWREREMEQRFLRQMMKQLLKLNLENLVLSRKRTSSVREIVSCVRDVP